MKRFATTIATVTIGLYVLAGITSGCGGGTGNAGGSGGTGGTTSSTTNSTTDSTTDSTTSSTTSTTTGNNPAPPALGAQIDRMGRPAINTALNHAFDLDMTKKGMAKDAYNAATDPTKWQGSYSADFAGSLAVLDGLDTVCGNQLLAKPANGGTIPADRYAPLAGALADDKLYIKTDAATCAAYLAVEANATGVLTNMDCGGRKLSYDVIDSSYSVLAAGALAGVTDGVPADADTAGTTFPYLAAPH